MHGATAKRRSKRIAGRKSSNPDSTGIRRRLIYNDDMANQQKTSSDPIQSDPIQQEALTTTSTNMNIEMLTQQNQALMQHIALQKQAMELQNKIMAQQMAEMNARMEKIQTDLLSSHQPTQQQQQPTLSSNLVTEDDRASNAANNNQENASTNNLQHSDGSSTSSVNQPDQVGNPAQPQQTGTGISSTLTHKPYELPEFSGRPEKWPVFIAAFKQSTQAFGYSPLQNIFRLQKCLKGEARDTVESLLICPDNIDELINTLEFRFGRPELLVRSQMDKVRELPDIFERRLDQLVPFSTRVTNMVAFLNTDASRHILNESTLLAELVSKLPTTKQLEWTNHTMSIQSRPTVIDFSQWLQKIAQCVSMLASASQAQPLFNSTSTKSSSGSNHPQSKRPGKHVLLNVQQSSQSLNCEVCSGSHKVTNCQRFRNLRLSERWATARRLQMCYKCLRSGHAIRDCEDKRLNKSTGNENDFNDLLNEPSVSHSSHQRRTTRRRRNDRRDSPVAVPESEATTSNPEKRKNPFDRTSSQQVVLTYRNEREDLPPLFRILPVTLYGPDRKAETYALLDEGSALTLIDERLSQYLQLNGPETNLNVQWIGQHGTSEKSKTVQLCISGASQRQYELKGVHTIRNLNLPTQSLDPSQLDKCMQELPIAEYQHVTPQILIGLDHCRLGMARCTRTSQQGGPIAAQTTLGWVTYGPQMSSSAHVLHVAEVDRWDHLDRVIREYLITDNFGVKRPEQVLESDDDIRARQILQATTIRSGPRYRTGLLWRSEDIVLPNSLAMAHQRLATVERKMMRNPDFRRLYSQQIEAYVKKGYARRLSKEEARVQTDRTWYLPHFGVETISKPGKLRLVFDAAATVNGTSLNSALLKGPDLNKPLVNILFQFRLRNIGICADIAEMFHQVEIQPCDRNSQRFLWRTTAGAKEPDVYEMRVMTFGASCSPTSAQYVKNLNASQYEKDHPEAVKAIHELHYVDDYVASFATEEEAIKVTGKVVEIHKQGGFILRGFVSNSRRVLNELGESNMASDGINLELDSEATDKILGLRWCTATDTFVFGMRFDRVDADVMKGLRRPTKRELLSASMSVFDPFGFIADYMMHTKIMIQALWRLGVAWDELVPEDTYRRWKAWCNEIGNIQKLNIPRCYSKLILIADEVQLHLFADASEEAFAAVGYWRIVHHGKSELAFIVGKVKCAPLKMLSVPRLELQAAVLASRLYITIQESHPDVKVSRTVLWTDSRTVQQWIQSTNRRFRPFVAHRVGEILDSTRATWWRWLPTEINVADDATRSSARPSFDPNSRWIRGPDFLLEDDSRWPNAPNTEAAPEDDPEEIQPRFVGMIMKYPDIIPINRFSNFLRLCRTSAWAMRFVNNTRARVAGEPKKSDELDVEEIQRATDILCRQAQCSGFPVEYAALDAGKPIDRSSSLIAMMPYLDDRKIIRLYGRTDAANTKYLPVDAQRPILLPRDHRFTELLIRYHHERMGHQFEDGTIGAIRRRYWVPKLRPLVRSVKKNCQFCKIHTVKPFPQIAGQLPEDRLTPHVPAFNFTGVDYFGPVNVTVGRRQEKRWIALFTCLTIRAVHMEVAQDLSTDSFLLCLRNFVNLRGVPARIRSDCGTNFVGADHEIRKLDDFLDQNEIQRQLSTRGIEWIMNCPANPEAGGAWERLVQSTKRVLAVILKEVAPRVETLRSLVIEAANILNSRPLTNVPVSPEDP